MKRKDKQPFSQGDFSSQSHSQMEGKPRQYIAWNKEMDAALSTVLYDQMNRGNRNDWDWKPQAYQAAVDDLNAKLQLNLTKDNVKNRLKAWKRHYGIISDIKDQSGLSWDDDKKMIRVTAENQKVWNDYVESHPDARGYQNKVIENWDDIVILCGKDRDTAEGAKNCKAIAEAITRDGEIEGDFIRSSLLLEAATMNEAAAVVNETATGVNEAVSTSRSQPPTHASDSTNSTPNSHQRKRIRKESLAEAILEMVTLLKEYLKSKQNHDRPRPTGEEIHEVVSEVPELTQLEVFVAVQRLMRGNSEEFYLLKSLPKDKKKEWVRFLLSHPW